MGCRGNHGGGCFAFNFLMKLLFCTKCLDVINLQVHKWKECSCGRAGGKYVDKENAEYTGGVPFAIDNNSFFSRLKKVTGKEFSQVHNEMYDGLYGKGNIQTWFIIEGSHGYDQIVKKKKERPRRILGACR